ncbi:hypothetical protein GCM10010420_12990 [Streptomyces glaucosporus]|uniref:Transposase n=1 Tax=Streptomyces glaucosporus TaxID=284044 RepID=A0ABN3HYW2_9ACTN
MREAEDVPGQDEALGMEVAADQVRGGLGRRTGRGSEHRLRRATAVTVLPEESTSAIASRSNSSVYRFVYSFPT